MLEPDALREELVDSRRVLLERFGRCDAIAYPFGHFNRAVAAAAAAAGYTFAYTVPKNGQPPAGRHAIPRVTVDRRDDERRFRLKLSQGGRRLLLSRLMPAARQVLHGGGRRRASGDSNLSAMRLAKGRTERR
jgi:hypothetical protein